MKQPSAIGSQPSAINYRPSSSLHPPSSPTTDPEHDNDELHGATRVELFIACCGLTVFVAWVFLIQLVTGELFRARRAVAKKEGTK